MAPGELQESEWPSKGHTLLVSLCLTDFGVRDRTLSVDFCFFLSTGNGERCRKSLAGVIFFGT